MTKMTRIAKWPLLLLAGGLVARAAAQEAPPTPHPVLELRQYKIVPGKRDPFIDLFEHQFIESQEALGMRLVGQFRDADDPNRFTWLRAFPDMTSRGTALNAFYFGPVWQAHRSEANPLLDDNDNVLLLRPATPDSGFADAKGPRPPIGTALPPAGMVVATIYYLWKDPDEGFAKFFHDEAAPRMAAAGLPVLGIYVPEKTPNNFPRLPVRQSEKLLVWFTRVPDQAAWDRAQAKLATDPAWKGSIAASLAGYQERAAQQLHLRPTPRSLLR
jgi:hypothetical protein